MIIKRAFVGRFAMLTGLLLCAGIAHAQEPPVNSPILDHLAGKWVMQGDVSGQKATHDIQATWVLDHHYLRIQETSREKNSKNKPQYEATVFIAWNEAKKQYAAVWLDVYGSITAGSIGTADPKENELLFSFKDDNGTVDLTNDFVFHPDSDTWEWKIDNIDKGVVKPFARFTLRRP